MVLRQKYWGHSLLAAWKHAQQCIAGGDRYWWTQFIIYCQRQYQSIYKLFWSIFQTMSIVVAFLTSIVQDNSQLILVYWSNQVYCGCVPDVHCSGQKPSIDEFFVGLLFKPCSLYCSDILRTIAIDEILMVYSINVYCCGFPDIYRLKQ